MRVITSSPNPFEGAYARFLETYVGPPLTVYTEAVDAETWNDKAEIKPLMQVPGLSEFLTFIETIPACRDHWKYDVHRFCRKSFVWFHEAKQGGPLFWLDSDIEWYAPLDASFLTDLLGDADMCYLGRNGYHPCTSFAGWNADRASGFFTALEKLYTSTMFLRLPEWHDAYLVGEVINAAPMTFKAKNLTPEGRPIENVFDRVFPFAHHMKGPRKFEAA